MSCINIRENTEWIETVEDGWNVLARADYEKVRDAILNFESAGKRSDVFGKGNASEKVCEALRSFFS